MTHVPLVETANPRVESIAVSAASDFAAPRVEPRLGVRTSATTAVRALNGKADWRSRQAAFDEFLEVNSPCYSRTLLRNIRSYSLEMSVENIVPERLHAVAWCIYAGFTGIFSIIDLEAGQA